MTDDLIERLRNLRVILKSGDYNGADLMKAWCAMADAADRLEAIANKLQRMEEALAGGYTLPTHMDCRFGIIDRDNGGKLIQQFDLEASLLANGDTITIPPLKITSA